MILRYLIISTLLFSKLILAAGVDVRVVDDKKNPVQHAIILAYAISDVEQPQQITKAEMRQEERQFSPFVLPVATNTEITFPNKDKVRHHVYSFSDAKSFELKLYRDFAGEPILFDSPGIVELGCNIHDWMLAYIYVTEAEFFGSTSESGELQLNLPEGEYRIEYWHPYANDAEQVLIKTVNITGGNVISLNYATQLEEVDDFSTGFDDYEY